MLLLFVRSSERGGGLTISISSSGLTCAAGVSVWRRDGLGDSATDSARRGEGALAAQSYFAFLHLSATGLCCLVRQGDAIRSDLTRMVDAARAPGQAGQTGSDRCTPRRLDTTPVQMIAPTICMR
eukprot:6175377-Pleurochrysis_carterae.AAC.4